MTVEQARKKAKVEFPGHEPVAYCIRGESVAFLCSTGDAIGPNILIVSSNGVRATIPPLARLNPDELQRL